MTTHLALAAVSYNMAGTVAASGIGETSIKTAIRRGDLVAHYVGNKLVIRAIDLDEWGAVAPDQAGPDVTADSLRHLAARADALAAELRAIAAQLEETPHRSVPVPRRPHLVHDSSGCGGRGVSPADRAQGLRGGGIQAGGVAAMDPAA